MGASMAGAPSLGKVLATAEGLGVKFSRPPRHVAGSSSSSSSSGSSSQQWRSAGSSSSGSSSARNSGSSNAGSSGSSSSSQPSTPGEHTPASLQAKYLAMARPSAFDVFNGGVRLVLPSGEAPEPEPAVKPPFVMRVEPLPLPISPSTQHSTGLSPGTQPPPPSPGTQHGADLTPSPPRQQQASSSSSHIPSRMPPPPPTPPLPLGQGPAQGGVTRAGGGGFVSRRLAGHSSGSSGAEHDDSSGSSGGGSISGSMRDARYLSRLMHTGPAGSQAMASAVQVIHSFAHGSSSAGGSSVAVTLAAGVGHSQGAAGELLGGQEQEQGLWHGQGQEVTELKPETLVIGELDKCEMEKSGFIWEDPSAFKDRWAGLLPRED